MKKASSFVFATLLLASLSVNADTKTAAQNAAAPAAAAAEHSATNAQNPAAASAQNAASASSSSSQGQGSALSPLAEENIQDEEENPEAQATTESTKAAS